MKLKGITSENTKHSYNNSEIMKNEQSNYSAKNILIAFAIMLILLLTGFQSLVGQTLKTKNIVLVHGAFADGSGWKPVYDILSKKGYHVSIVQNPLTSLKNDVNATNSVINQQDGQVVLVGHSWGGTVITEAGNNPKVVALVYVAAFVPDHGENTIQWITAAPASPEAGFTKPDEFGFVYFEYAKFHKGFASDLTEKQSNFMRDSQIPIIGRSFEDMITKAAWKTKPVYAVLATDDKALSPVTQRNMYKRANAKITEVKASHVVFISNPEAVANTIIQAAEGK